MHPLHGRVGAVGHFEPADPAENLVGAVGLNLVELVGDALLPLCVVDRRAGGCSEDRHDVTTPVSAVDLVGQHRGAGGLASVVIETALRDVLAQAHPEDAAAEAQRHHHRDHNKPVAVHGATPPGEHLNS
jgi:hypothetical protein